MWSPAGVQFNKRTLSISAQDPEQHVALAQEAYET